MIFRSSRQPGLSRLKKLGVLRGPRREHRGIALQLPRYGDWILAIGRWQKKWQICENPIKFVKISGP